MTLFQDFIAANPIRQADLARQLDITQSYLSLLIRDKKTPSLDLALRIEDVTRGAVPAASWRKGCCEAAE